MKTLNNITLYKCDHCNKKLQRKHAMITHEIKCSQNQNNIRACFDCSLCEKVEIKYERTIQIYEDETLLKSHSFKCLSKKTFMHPPKLEYLENGVPDYVLHEGLEILQEKMPLVCEIKDRMDEDMSKLFNY